MEQVEPRIADLVKPAAAWQGTGEQLLRISRAIQKIVDLYARAYLGPADELRQEAWVVALEAAPRWDPAKGADLGTYVEFSLRTGVARAMSRQRCSFSLSKGAASVGVGYEIEERAKEARLAVGLRLEDLDRLQDERWAPDLEAQRAENERRLAMAAERRRLAYKRAAARLRPAALREFAEAFMARIWMGMEVEDPGELAVELGVCTAEQARRAVYRMRTALREDPDVAEAMDAYAEMEE